jgi:Flp pilus assembly protein TadG
MPVSRISRNKRKKLHRRSGVATLEFAIVLPVLIALTLGTMDICSMMFLRETAVLAAYEGARNGVGRGHTDQDVTSRITEFLDERGVTHNGSSGITISSPGFTSADTLENVTVTVNIPTTGNLLIPSQMISGMTITASVTMRKEYKNLPN